MQQRERGAGSIFHQSYKSRDGKTAKSKTWMIQYPGSDGKSVREATGSKDYAVAEALLALRISQRPKTRAALALEEAKSELNLANVQVDIKFTDAQGRVFHGTQYVQVRMSSQVAPNA